MIYHGISWDISSVSIPIFLMVASSCKGFLKWGVPPNHPFFHRSFHYIPFGVPGIPPFMEPPIYDEWILYNISIYLNSQHLWKPPCLFAAILSQLRLQRCEAKEIRRVAPWAIEGATLCQSLHISLVYIHISLSKYIYIYLFTLTYIYILKIYTYIYTDIYIYMYLYKYLDMYLYKYLFIYIYTVMFILIYIYTYIYTYRYIYIYF